MPFLPPVGLALHTEDESLDWALDLHVDVMSFDSLTELESTLGLFAAEHLRELVAVHAALIAFDELAILLPGSSMCGKSTLAKSALEQGIVVASDEYALIDPATGTARGWPRPIGMRTAEGRRRIHGAVDARPLRISLVAGLQYQESVSESLVTAELTGGELVMLLLGNTVCARTRPEDSLRAASAVANQALGIQGVRGEAEGALSALFELARAGAAPS